MELMNPKTILDAYPMDANSKRWLNGCGDPCTTFHKNFKTSIHEFVNPTNKTKVSLVFNEQLGLFITLPYGFGVDIEDIEFNFILESEVTNNGI